MPFSWESEELRTGDSSLISKFREKKLQISQPTTMVNCLGTAKEFYLFTDMCKTLQTSPFFILFSLTAISFKIWSVFNLLTSKIIHTHPSEKRLGGFPDRWEATPYPPSFSGPFCRGQTRLFLLCFLLSFLLPLPHSLVCRATFFPQRIPSRYTHLGWPGLTQVASTLVSLFIFFFNRFYLKNFWGFFLMWTMCYKVASVLCFVFFGHKACGILIPWPVIESTTLAL